MLYWATERNLPRGGSTEWRHGITELPFHLYYNIHFPWIYGPLGLPLCPQRSSEHSSVRFACSDGQSAGSWKTRGSGRLDAQEKRVYLGGVRLNAKKRAFNREAGGLTPKKRAFN